ncbi:MAG TPA: acetyl-CoA carboxylase biotin carboxylase subunit [Solirubrobacteraceae bacterium]|nr:acetyl-CoA carboxylase biotin carboxylase subunit [Solirubrobacteraceae bacterium]
MFTRVLVANRGEIAVRVIRALEELGVESVAVYSELDREALHVRRADSAYLLGGASPAESYLNIARILELAGESGAEAIHPGYGFLAESAAFAAACEAAGIVFIGPPASAIEAMGSKTRARELMAAAGVPIVPGTTAPVASVAEARRIIEAEIGYPVAVKAAGGGGGKGFRVALADSELEDAFAGAAREGEKFFGDDTVYLERYLPDPRHVEVQVLADAHGAVVHLGERDCSIQRRHQKLIEESPAPSWIVDEALRERIGKIATDAARAVDYSGAGTIEGLLSGDEYFFLEMNTRVQVEHCVTEMTSGIDIVKTGIRVAAGEPLPFTQGQIVLRGHAIECRINAEDAALGFVPAPGRITSYREPAGPGVRVDSGVLAGSEISPNYDPMIAKLIVWDSDRAEATRRMLRALDEYEIGGVTTLLPFHRALLATEQWERGETCRDLLEDPDWLKASAPPLADAVADGVQPNGRSIALDYTVEVSGKRFEVKVIGPPGGLSTNGSGPARAQRSKRERSKSTVSGDVLTSPMQGTVLKIATEAGAQVEEGALVAIIEAMKMENEVTAHKSGTIVSLAISVGAAVGAGDTLAVIASPAE